MHLNKLIWTIKFRTLSEEDIVGGESWGCGGRMLVISLRMEFSLLFVSVALVLCRGLVLSWYISLYLFCVIRCVLYIL